MLNFEERYDRLLAFALLSCEMRGLYEYNNMNHNFVLIKFLIMISVFSSSTSLFWFVKVLHSIFEKTSNGFNGRLNDIYILLVTKNLLCDVIVNKKIHVSGILLKSRTFWCVLTKNSMVHMIIFCLCIFEKRQD